MSIRRPRLGALTSIVEVHLKDSPEVMSILEAAEKTIGELRAAIGLAQDENARLRGDCSRHRSDADRLLRDLNRALQDRAEEGERASALGKALRDASNWASSFPNRTARELVDAILEAHDIDPEVL